MLSCFLCFFLMVGKELMQAIQGCSHRYRSLNGHDLLHYNIYESKGMTLQSYFVKLVQSCFVRGEQSLVKHKSPLPIKRKLTATKEANKAVQMNSKLNV